MRVYSANSACIHTPQSHSTAPLYEPHLENVDFPAHFLGHLHVLDLALVQDFDGHLQGRGGRGREREGSCEGEGGVAERRSEY